MTTPLTLHYKVLATVPDLIFLLDVSTGENIGTQEYRYVHFILFWMMETRTDGEFRYGLKVTVMIVAPHPIWVTKRGLEIVGPRVFHLPYDYTSPIIYTKPRSVIEEFRVKDSGT